MTNGNVSDGKFDETLINKRIKLLKTNDPYTNLKQGDTGIIVDVKKCPIEETVFTQIWVNWDNGNRLALIPESNDQFELI